MATSKTLAPTNVTISIPAMTDQPNASVLANCADKEADAINALNSQKATLVQKTIEAGSSVSITFSAYATYAIFFCGYVETSRGLIVGTADASNILYKSVSAASDITITSSGLTATFQNGGQYSVPLRMLLFSGTAT